MNIYIVDDDPNFSKNDLEKLGKCGKVILQNSFDKLEKQILSDNSEKILALSPTAVAWKFSNELIGKIPKLMAICLPTTGFEWIDGKFCRKMNINLTNVPHYSTESVAEYMLFYMLCLARKLPLQIKNNFKLDYSSNMIQVDLKDKKVGIVGLGDIGQRIGEICKNLGMDVYYWSRNEKKTSFKYLALDKLVSSVDFVLPTLALNDETINFLDKKVLSKMKKTSYLVSTCHEKDEKTVFDKEFLIKQAETGKIAGLAFRSSENLTNFKGNIMTTEHYAWYTKESIENDYKIWVDTMISIFKNTPKNVVN